MNTGYLGRNFNFSMAVYVLLLAAGSASGIEITQIVPLNAESIGINSHFGTSVAIWGDRVLVGAPGEAGATPGPTRVGAAYVFDAYTGQQLMTLSVPELTAADGFGYSVALEGNVALVGAPSTTEAGMAHVGRVYAFDITTGQQIDSWTAPDAVTNHQFGIDLAMRDGRAVVGASPPLTHGAYLYDLSASPPSLTAQLTDNTIGGFGEVVDISVAHVIVAGSNTGLDGGDAVIYDTVTGTRLTAFGGTSAGNDGFGFGVAISEDFAVVSAPLYGYSDDGPGGVMHVMNSPPTGDISVLFPVRNRTPIAENIAIDGRTVIYDDSTSGTSSHWRVRLLDLPSGTILATIPLADGVGGAAVDIKGNLAVYGVAGDDTQGNNAGAAYVIVGNPIPEPATLVMFGFAIALTQARPRRSGRRCGPSPRPIGN